MFNLFGKKNQPEPPLDPPRNFGSKTAWLAVKSEATEQILEKLSPKKKKPANWTQGIDAAYQGNLFIAPPLAGWTLIVGEDLPELSESESLDFLKDWSATFDECQLFRTHRIVDLHSWALAKSGVLIRAFCWIGESGEFLVNSGDLTPPEKELGLSTEGPTSNVFPKETTVMSIAQAWSLDPSQLEQTFREPTPLGWIITPPRF